MTMMEYEDEDEDEENEEVEEDEERDDTLVTVPRLINFGITFCNIF